MPNDGALVVVTRYARDALSLQRLHHLPDRPARLRLSHRNLGPFECGGTYDLQFREHGRGFKVDVWYDPDEVNPRTRRDAHRRTRATRRGTTAPLHPLRHPADLSCG